MIFWHLQVIYFMVYYSCVILASKGVCALKEIPKISVGDILEMKKEHPCGARRFSVLRIGSDIRIVCSGCGRDMVFPREKIEKMIKKVFPKEDEHDG